MINLTKMTEKEFSKYKNSNFYVQEILNADDNKSEIDANKKADEQFYKLLPNGVHTINNFLYSIIEKDLGHTIGMIWFAIEKEKTNIVSFGYDIYIDHEYRKRGYATAALEEAMNKSKKLGANTFQVHVFNHNTESLKLCFSAGFKVIQKSSSSQLLEIRLE